MSHEQTVRDVNGERQSLFPSLRDHAMIRSDPDGAMIAALASLVIECRDELIEGGCMLACDSLPDSTPCSRCRVMALITAFDESLVRQT